MEPHRSPAQLIADSEGLLLDFDGPVCDVYAGSDAARIARDVAARFNLDIETNDPLDLITHALATGGPVDAIHQALTETEVQAVRTAAETPGIGTLLQTYDGAVAIVSNNARQAIDLWLREVDLKAFVSVITGRDPRHMKPDPMSLRTSAAEIERPLNRCVFVGDSLTDLQAAERAHVPFIALANEPNKGLNFRRSGTLTVDSIYDLTPNKRLLPPKR